MNIKEINKILEKEKYGVISVLGMRGSGKTYMSSQLEFNTDKTIYLDVVGAFNDYLKKFKEEYVNIEIDREFSTVAYKKFIEKMMLSDDKIINIDISLLSREEMINFVNVLTKELILKNSFNKTVSLVIDEVGEIAEQERIYYSDGLESALRIGRNKGILWITLITQRPQKVNKHLLALSDYYIIFKLRHNLDRDAVRKILGYTTREFKNIDEKLKKQEIGEFIFTDTIQINMNKKDITEKEIEVMKNLRKKGMLLKEIAKIMDIDENLVKYYLIRRDKKQKDLLEMQEETKKKQKKKKKLRFLSEEEKEKIKKMIKQGKSRKEILKKFKISSATLYRIKKKVSK